MEYRLNGLQASCATALARFCLPFWRGVHMATRPGVLAFDPLVANNNRANYGLRVPIVARVGVNYVRFPKPGRAMPQQAGESCAEGAGFSPGITRKQRRTDGLQFRHHECLNIRLHTMRRRFDIVGDPTANIAKESAQAEWRTGGQPGDSRSPRSEPSGNAAAGKASSEDRVTSTQNVPSPTRFPDRLGMGRTVASDVPPGGFNALNHRIKRRQHQLHYDANGKHTVASTGNTRADGASNSDLESVQFDPDDRWFYRALPPAWCSD